MSAPDSAEASDAFTIRKLTPDGAEVRDCRACGDEFVVWPPESPALVCAECHHE